MKTVERYQPPEGSVMPSADAAVDPRKASRAWGVVAWSLVVVTYLAVNNLYDTANREAGLNLVPDATVVSPGMPGAVLLIDGLRRSEANELNFGNLTALDLRVALPSVSVPVYHEMATGVSRSSSGIQTNRFHDGPRYDSIADVARRGGRKWRFVSDDPKWMAEVMRFTDAETTTADDLKSFLAAIDAWDPSKEALFIHYLALDTAGHDGKVNSNSRKEALRNAAQIAKRVIARDVKTVIFSDHGHVDDGGHGGDEPECVRAVCYVSPSIAQQLITQAIEPVHLASIIGNFVGGPPKHAEFTALKPTFTQQTRQQTGVLHLVKSRARRERGRVPSLMLTLLLCIATLGTVKRCFGISFVVFAAPLIMWSIAGLMHWFWRPFGMSSIDYVYLQIARLAFGGMVGSVVCIAIFRRSVLTKRQVAGGLIWGSAVSVLLSAAHLHFTLFPWPGDLESYAPMAFAGTALGVFAVAGTRLLLLSREPKKSA